ncbi:MAG: monovalent cation:proton antiporter-2 (CPA2) family protein [Pseudomonadales bacterium]
MTFLLQVLIFLGAAILVVPVCKRLGLSVVLGYLAAGILIGPDAIGLIGEQQEAQEVMHFAEIGIVFLLFVIGLELQPRRLWVMRRVVFGLGTMQVVTTSAVLTAAIAVLFSLPWPTALLLGFSLALSSTAFVLQLLAERKALNHPHGRAAFGTLLLQDVAVIPAIALLDLINPAGSPSSSSGQDILLIGLVLAGLVLARFALRPLLRFVAGSGIHELFTAAALALVVGAAIAMESVGLSMGLGAFIAGMMVADSEYRHQLETDVAPFKGLLLGLFFIAVGMSVDLKLLIEIPLLIIALTVGLMAVKSLLLYSLCRAIGLNHGESLRTSTILSQGGEFGFVLLTAGLLAALVDGHIADIAVLVITASMVLTPLFVAAAERLLGTPAQAGPYDEITEPGNPVVIAGFGRFGQIIGRILTMRHIPFTALESSSSQVEFVRQFGNRVYYGDPANVQLLRSAGIEHAKAIVIAVDDMDAAIRIASEARSNWPNTKIFARARNRQHALRLTELGVDHVIRETLASSLALGTDVLTHLGIGREEAEKAIEVFRAHDAMTLEKQLAVHHDNAAYRASTVDAARELEELFIEDARASDRV